MNAIIWYNQRLSRFPVLTKSITGSFVFVLGDFLCQGMELYLLKKDKKFDVSRCMKQAVFGFIVAPYLHFQYNVFIPRLFPGTSKYAFFKSVCYAILISDTIFNFAFFFYMGYIKHRNTERALKELPEN